MNTTAIRTTSFAVDSVPTGTEVLPTEKVKQSVEKLLGTRVEVCDNYTADVVEQPGFHTLVAAADLAYQLHFPLVLSPDMIWLTIAQGLANHVNNNAEALRKHFVSHQGKHVIQVRRDDFIRGSAENPWPEVWPVFSDKIREHIGQEAHRLIVSAFSTTGPTERAASEIVLMDTVQSYFSYEFITKCGIPVVTLEGTPEDWAEIHDRVGRLERFDLKWWTDEVRPITEEFIKAARGEPTHSFWKCLFKQEHSSGGPYLSGWLVRLLPYLKHREYHCEVPGDYRTGRYTSWKTDLRNSLLEKPMDHGGPWYGVKHDRLPSSVSQVPFIWNYHGTQFDYEFLAGLMTITQDEDTKSIRPRVGWAVRPASTNAAGTK